MSDEHYSHCRSCEKPLRPQRARLEDHPGTVRRSGRGMCTVCYRKSRNGDFPEVTLPEHLTKFIENRRRRGIPVEGVLYAGEK